MSARNRTRTIVIGLIAVAAIGLTAMPAAAVTIPSAPNNLTGTAGPKVAQVTLHWALPTDTGGGIATYLYDVATDYNPTTGTGTWSALVNMNQNTLRKAVPCAATYPAVCTYRVYARNAAGTSPPSAPVTVPWTVPTKARNVKASSTNFSDASVSWSAPANTGGQPVSYDVSVSNDQGLSYSTLATNLTTLNYFAPASCTNGFVCLYEVRSKNVVGPATSLPTPGKIGVQPGNVTLTVTKTADDVTVGNLTSGSATMSLSWTVPTFGLHDGPYEMQECQGVCNFSSMGWTASLLIPNATLSTVRMCAADLITCSYRVRATNTRGGYSRLWSYAVWKPTAPFGVSAVTGSTTGTITVTFSGPSTTGPAISTAHYTFLVCTGDCSLAANWGTSPTTAPYPPSTQPFSTDVACPTAGAACSVRVQFVNDLGNVSMVSPSASANAAS